MPTLVHLTPEKNVTRILRSGITLQRAGEYGLAGVYCMPVLPDFFVMHQWLRELKRRGGTFHRTMVGITFRLASDEPVLIGHYAREHVQMSLGEAIRLLMQQADARGYEIIVPRAIGAHAIRGVRHLPQVVGWRNMPDANGRPPCTCPVCLPRGQYKSVSIRERLDPEPKPPTKAALLARLRATGDDQEIEDVLWQLRARRRGGGEELAHLMRWPSARVRVALASAMGVYRGPTARRLLRQLADDPDAEVREEALMSLGERSDS